MPALRVTGVRDNSPVNVITDIFVVSDCMSNRIQGNQHMSVGTIIIFSMLSLIMNYCS